MFLYIWLAVADYAIYPKVGDPNFEGVCAGLQIFCDVDAEWGFPQDTNGFTVHGDLGEIFDVAEVEPESGLRLKPSGLRLHGLCVRGGAGKISHALVGVPAPVGERGEGYLGGGAAIFLEGDVPGAVDSGDRLIVTLGKGA